MTPLRQPTPPARVTHALGFDSPFQGKSDSQARISIRPIDSPSCGNTLHLHSACRTGRWPFLGKELVTRFIGPRGALASSNPRPVEKGITMSRSRALQHAVDTTLRPIRP